MVEMNINHGWVCGKSEKREWKNTDDDDDNDNNNNRRHPNFSGY